MTGRHLTGAYGAFFVILAASLNVLSEGGVIYVDSRAAGANNGTSWTDAFCDLQDALSAAAASEEVEEIRVAQGTYTPARPGGPRTASFHLPNSTIIKGGFAGVGCEDPDARDIASFATYLSGDLLGNDRTDALWWGPWRSENVYHVVMISGCDETTVLDGVTIVGGNASDYANDNGNGGGILNASGSPTIVDCVMRHNSAENRYGGGGGMYNRNGRPRLIRCRFERNGYMRANGNGGGAMLNVESSPVLEDCTFSSNTSKGHGGAVLNIDSNPEVVRCTFSGSTADLDGGAIKSVEGEGTFTDCEFIFNISHSAGGAIFNDQSHPVLKNCLFSKNVVMAIEGKGGAIYNRFGDGLVAADCVFTDNAAWFGGAIYSDHGSCVLTGCFFARHETSRPGGAVYNDAAVAQISECIFVENSGSCGGAVYSYGTSVQTIERCTFRKNKATLHGGAIADTRIGMSTISNSLFAENSARAGGAVASEAGAQRIINSTFVGNVADSGGVMFSDDSDVRITNCICWHNPGGGGNGFEAQFDCTGGALAINHSCIEGWTGGSGEGVIGADPMFAAGDAAYRLPVYSPCVDTGDNSVVRPGSLDIVGRERVFRKAVDMGAREYRPLTIIYVDDDACDAGDGSSWKKALAGLQDALAIARNGDEIHLAGGTYTPAPAGGARSASFHLKRGAAIRGGYAGCGNPDPDARDFYRWETILSGDLNRDDGGDFSGCEENSYHVLVAAPGIGPETILEGVTITAGYANGPDPDGAGGGLTNRDADPVLVDCRFIANRAAWCGGAVANSASSPTIINCLFTANRADGFGGGAVSNHEWSVPLIMNCRFIANLARSGGALANDQPGNFCVLNCLFAGNVADYGGGAIYNDDCGQILINCTFVGNRAERRGAISNDENSMWHLNCIFWDNQDGDGSDETSQYNIAENQTIENCCVGGLVYEWPQSHSRDPMFVDPGRWEDGKWISGCYRLLAGSPCLDAGDNAFLEPEMVTDLDGNPRIINGTVDIGAFEKVTMIEGDLWVAPRVINRANSRGTILARVRLPENVAIDDIDRFQALVLLPGGAAAERQYAFTMGRGSGRRVTIFAFFQVAALLEAVEENGPVELTVTGALLDGRGFSARDTITLFGRPTPARTRAVQPQPVPGRAATPLKSK